MFSRLFARHPRDLLAFGEAKREAQIKPVVKITHARSPDTSSLLYHPPLWGVASKDQA